VLLPSLGFPFPFSSQDNGQPWVVQLGGTASPDGPVTQRLAHYFLQAQSSLVLVSPSPFFCRTMGQPWVVQLRGTAAPDGPVTQRLAHYFLQALGKRFEGHSQLEEAKPTMAAPPKQLFTSKNVSAPGPRALSFH